MVEKKERLKQNNKKIIHFGQNHESYDTLNTVLFPETTKLNGKHDLSTLLNKYRHVILKPISSHKGAVVIKVSLDWNHQYKIQYDNKILEFTDIEKTFVYLKNKINSKPYLVQQYIQLATIRNRPFYLMVKVKMNKEELVWRVIEKYAKFEEKSYTKTKSSQNSELFTMNEAFAHLNLPNELLVDIDYDVLKVVQKLSEVSPDHYTWELNIGVDSSGKLWMISANSKPERIKGQKQNIYTILKTDKYVSPLLPETAKLNGENDLWMMLKKYLRVILKPISGSLGIGVIKVSKDSNDQYKIQHRNEILSFENKKQTFAYLKDKIKSKPYLVQQYIQLAKIGNRPSDLRVIVQRKKGEPAWKVTGIYAKVAHEGYFTTNLARKGKVLTVNQAIDRSNLKGVNTDELLRDIDNAALRVAQKLSEVSPHHRIWGLDIGIDTDRNLWIIEANSKPGMNGFKRLKNGSMYKTIQEYRGVL